VSKRIPRVVAGTNVNRLRQPLNRIIDRVNSNSEVLAGPVGALEGTGATTLLLVEIKTLNAANLICVLPGTADPEEYDYEVELPQTFNESSRGGVTYVYTDINNRTADGTEVQQLTPIYIVGDLLMISEANDGQFWIDLNVDGRQWAKVP